MRWCLAVAILLAARIGHAQAPTDTVTIKLVNVDLRSAIQVLSQYVDRPVIFGAVTGNPITLQTPRPVRRGEVLPLLRAALESQNLELFADSVGPYVVRPKQVAPVTLPPSVTAGGPLGLHVIQLRHARAADVAATVNALYGRASAFGELGPPPATLNDQLRQNTQATMNPVAGTVHIGSGGAASLSGETTIIPDPRSNSLLVRANRQDYELIAAAVRELDVRPLQVLIQMVIVEVRRDRSLAFGVDVTLPPHQLPTNPDVTVEGSQLGSSVSDAVLKIVGIGGIRDLETTLRAAASRGEVSIMSRPSVIAANNERAEILVGSQRPFVQVSRSLATDSPSRDQVVQYKDVGTKLIIRPTISTDGYVMLEVTQEVNAATNETAFDAPVISTRSLQTRLLLKDGQTVVIGGLTDRQRDITQSGTPILSSIPLIGGLFGRTSRRTTETELYLFITPHVLKTDEDADALTRPLQDRTGQRDSTVFPIPPA